jgi:hypothetical protein
MSRTIDVQRGHEWRRKALRVRILEPLGWSDWGCIGRGETESAWRFSALLSSPKL